MDISRPKIRASSLPRLKFVGKELVQRGVPPLYGVTRDQSVSACAAVEEEASERREVLLRVTHRIDAVPQERVARADL